jgi:predicted enzyme related to lactoylglutathione lyase
MTQDHDIPTARQGQRRRQISAGVVLYAKNLPRVSAFYAAVLGLRVTESESYHVVLESASYQLSVVEMPSHLVGPIRSTDSLSGRRETALKLVFVVPSISDARPLVTAHGGQLLPPAREWRFQDWIVCDGQDPEGNVLQLRELR